MIHSIGFSKALFFARQGMIRSIHGNHVPRGNTLNNVIFCILHNMLEQPAFGTSPPQNTHIL